jgi:hypothetical protein
LTPASDPRAGAATRRRRAAALILAASIAAALAIVGQLPGHASSTRAAGAGPEVDPQTDASVPAQSVTMLAATPEEAGAPGPNETWGIGSNGRTPELVRYAAGVGWMLGPGLPSGFSPEDASPLAGAMTPRGAGVLAGTEPGGEGKTRDVVLVRDPGGAFTDTTPVPSEGEGSSEPLLHKDEVLFAGASSNRDPMLAPLDEEDGKAGALVAPVDQGSGPERQVLHWDGASWTSEQIAIPAKSSEDFRVLAIAATSPGNAWLLGQLSSAYPSGSVALFHRVKEGETWAWKPVTLSAGGGDGEAHPLVLAGTGGGQLPFTVPGAGSPPSVRAQLLTASGEGVWVDGQRADVHARTPDSATLFFRGEGTAGGQVTGSWCAAPPEGGEGCQYALQGPLPSPFDRSFAWGGGGYGERLITGFPGGISWRLQGTAFTRVLALGGGENSEQTPGARFGAAFTKPEEGWLGLGTLPVHVTTSPEPTHLTPWSVPFRHPLLAIAPQPGAAVGALTSEALAVGDQGAVARYKPGAGGAPGQWVPESLFGPGQRLEKPRLRAVAWPTPGRAYAVGDLGHEIGEQMWLWRGETGLWEHDPAAPLNFTGNLLGIAFDPNNPTRGYAVGTKTVGRGGVLLRYGKSWTQEPVPPEVQQAELVAIAFAGSQAIVAYRLQPDPNVNRFVGGLLLNDGSGWRVDSEAAGVIGEGTPTAVAGLPDGGAAFEMTSPGSGPRVFERQSPGAPWQATPTPLPGSNQGSLSMFREGGALRAIVSGGGGVANQSEAQQPPPGFPPNLIPPLSPGGGGADGGGLLRQTAPGWRDEGHELDDIGPPAGGSLNEDIPYRPDSIFATLVDPSGGGGWAVGGNLDANERVETGNVARYQANASEAAGAPSVETAAIEPEAGATTFAFGGHAECAAPCAERARARIGPLVWLSSAVALANRSGAQAFIYTGPSVTADQVGGVRSVPIRFEEELGLNAAILASGPTIPSFVAASPEDLDARPEREGAEAAFANAFSGFPQSGLPAADRSPEQCAGSIGCQAAYYSFTQGGVQVIVLDDTGDVNATQVSWLEEKLAEAATAGRPAIVVGAADLAAQVNAGDGQADRVAAALTRPLAGASAYFFDAPEEDVRKPLSFAGQSIPSFGSGTLGYIEQVNEQAGNFHGASGILLGQVDVGSYRSVEPGTDRAKVTAQLIPVIGELATEAKDGTLLRRSQAALFAGLARRPRAGAVATTNNTEQRLDPYIPIPEICVGACATAMQPTYKFESSNEEVAMFVQHNTASVDPHAVLQNTSGEPIFEHGAAVSGLLCALNKGETTITITAGGLRASQRVTVQAGSVRQPCGTTPLKHRPVSEQQTAAPPPPPPQPAPATSAPTSTPPVVPLPPPPLVAALPPVARPAPQPFIPLAAPPTPLLAFVPPPVPTPARPTPPSGTSAVTSPVEVAEKEEEQEEATESVSNQAVAYRASDELPEAPFVIGFLVLAAFAGVSMRSSMRRRRGRPRIAPATVVSARAQRGSERASGHDR